MQQSTKKEEVPLNLPKSVYIFALCEIQKHEQNKKQRENQTKQNTRTKKS